MKSLITFGEGKAELINSQSPIIESYEILIAPILTGICGTDLEIIQGKIDPAYVIYPVVIGHEWCGQVVEVGSLVSEIQVGDRVVVEGIVSCGHCSECLSGSSNRCTTYDEIGFTRPGAASELIKVPSALVHKVLDSVSNESATLVEPSSVVTQGILKASPKIGAKVLVIGDGTIALIAARLLQNWKPSTVHMLGLKSDQVQLASQAGVEEFFTVTPQEKYDLIIEASGSSSRISESIRLLLRGGTLLLLGFTGADVMTPLSIDDVVNADLSILASFGYSRSAWKATVELLNSGKLDLTFLVTHRFPLEKFDEAIQALESAPAPRGKIVLEIGK
jgi:2-desacetyl-2-hydroxyethyl bacteriochlorophyllide A dehydrogenase